MHKISFYYFFPSKKYFWDFSSDKKWNFSMCSPQATKRSLRKMLTGSLQLILIEISYSVTHSHHIRECVWENCMHIQLEFCIDCGKSTEKNENYNLCAFEQFHECEWYILFFSSSAYKKTIPAHTFECLFMFSVAVGWISELFFLHLLVFAKRKKNKIKILQKPGMRSAEFKQHKKKVYEKFFDVWNCSVDCMEYNLSVDRSALNWL